MEFCLNKHTGQYFIYLKRERGGKLLLITPDSRVMSLEEDMFEEPFEENEKLLLSQGTLDPKQLERLAAYRRSRIEEERLRFETMVGRLQHIKPEELPSYVEKVAAQVRMIQELEGGNN